MTSTGNPTGLHQMVGRVFGDRYRIEELIGIGAISAVYTAYDPVEGIWVALKVFHEALAADDRFVERLLDAVEQAAVLGHPNIVEIYDWGNDDGPYIVSELCEGGSLATMIATGERLAASQALVVTLECTRALNYGHDQGRIHRKLTPNNILFSADEHVRISDYGLAEVLSDAPVSQAARALENVRYASPEQARGRPLTESSDMYSLALVVNEAVSGEPPTVAETVVGTLMARAESSAELDPSLGGLLPSLERCGRVEPVERPEAGELSIALLAAAETMERPTELPLAGLTTPDEVGDFLLRVAGGAIGKPDDTFPGVMADLDSSDSVVSGIEAGDGLFADSEFGDNEIGDGEVGDSESGDSESGDVELGDIELGDIELGEGDFDVSSLGDLDDIDGFAADEVVSQSADGPRTEEPSSEELLTKDPSVEETVEPALALVANAPTPGAFENLDEPEPVFAPDSAPQDDSSELDIPERTPARHAGSGAYEQLEDDADDQLPWWPLLVLGLLVAAAVAAGAYFLVLDSADDATVVPDLIGVPFDEVASRIQGRGWELERLEGRVDGSVVGSIVSQSPSGGTTLGRGEPVTVTVSLGNAMVEIPSDIIGLTVDQAASRLGSVGLALGRLSEEESEDLAAGLVVGLNEPTTQKPSGQGVALRVSRGPEDRFVPPEVVGMTIGDATSLLVGLRLQAVEEPTYNPDIAAGIVLGTIPEPGSTVPADSAVTLFVSDGPEPVVMPDIVGLALDEAIDELESLGLIFIDTEGTPGEDVIGSLPPIGATVDVGTEVLIYLDDPAEEDEEDN